MNPIPIIKINTIIISNLSIMQNVHFALHTTLSGMNRSANLSAFYLISWTNNKKSTYQV